MKKLFTMIVMFGLNTVAYAATPTITNVSGTVSTGQTLTITGTNMVNENTSNWDSNFSTYSNMYGFEGTINADGYHTSADSNFMPVYDSTVKLAGNKSLKMHVFGKTGCSPNCGSAGMSSYPNASSVYYGRWYARFNAVNNIWPDNYTKQMGFQPSSGNGIVYFDIGGGNPSNTFMYFLNGNSFTNQTVSPLQNNRWYCFEVEANNSTHVYKMWLDGALIFTGSMSITMSNNYNIFGIINYDTINNTADLTEWWDNFAYGKTSRIYPSSTIAISGDGGSTWKWQPPIFLSDTSITVSEELPTLTASNYMLRVTNNLQQTSSTYNLTGGGSGTSVTPVNGACGTANGQAFTSLTSASANLCSTGTVASFAGSGPWTWGCTGSGGGISTSSTACTASLTPASTPTATLLFSESFENNSYASRGWYDNTNQGTIVSGGQSGNSLQWSWAQGATTPTNGGATRKEFTPTDSLYVSYYVKFQTGWRGSQQTYHPHMIYILSDLDDSANAYSPLANNYLNTYLEFVSDVGSPYAIRPLIAIQDEKRVNTSNGTPPNNLTAVTENRSVAYCNSPVSAGATGICYADNPYYSANTWKASSDSVSTNEWHHVEVYLKMNTISGGKGQSNGIMQQWIDGSQVINRSDVLYRTNQDATKKWAQFVLAPYIGDGSPIAQTMWIDELTLATSPPNANTSITSPGGLMLKSVTP